MDRYGNFINEIFSRLAKQYPEHEFFFIFDQQFDERYITERNISPIIAGPQAKYPLLWKYWFDTKIPSLLKKIQADVFVSCDGYCSLKTAIPQCLVLQDLSFLNEPLYIKKSHATYLKKYTPRFINKAKSVAVVSKKIRHDIQQEYSLMSAEIDIVYEAGRDVFQPVGADEKLAVQKKYTDGKEYFIYAGSIKPEKNLINLLRAFSVFKKRQQTNMKLLLAGSIDMKYESFKKDLQSYKYRSDVVLVEYLDETDIVKLIGSAYGFINPSLEEVFPVAALEAMQCNVPAIVAETDTAKEILKEAGLYVDASSHAAMADKMMLLYKDESLRNDLIIKGRKISSAYSWDEAAQSIWQSIQKAIG